MSFFCYVAATEGCDLIRLRVLHTRFTFSSTGDSSRGGFGTCSNQGSLKLAVLPPHSFESLAYAASALSNASQSGE